MTAGETRLEESQSARRLGPVFNAGWMPVGERERLRTERSVARAARGDRDALRELYVRYSQGVYGYVRSIVGDDHEAEDVTQQVFLKLMTALPAFASGRAQFSAWLLRVARNTAIDHLRRRRHTVASDPLTWRTGATEADAVSGQSLRDVIGALSHDQCQVLLLRQVLGLTPHQVAERLGKSEGAVHNLYYRARVAARANLEGLGATPATRHRERDARAPGEYHNRAAVVRT